LLEALMDLHALGGVRILFLRLASFVEIVGVGRLGVD